MWAGISVRERTGVCVFDGIMDAHVYVTILEKPLIPFLREVYPDHHRFMQDNDPKHTSRRAWEFFEQNRINWWQTPPESPDLNPIENLWHVLKEFLRREVKPTSKQELVTGIEQFWETVTVENCSIEVWHFRHTSSNLAGCLHCWGYSLKMGTLIFHNPSWGRAFKVRDPCGVHFFITSSPNTGTVQSCQPYLVV